MLTKGLIVTEAFAELALAGNELDIDPEERATALRRLDMMMAAWEGKGIRVGYAFAGDLSNVDPDADSGLPMVAAETVTMNLARRMAAGFGKPLTPTQMQVARDGYDTLLRAAAFPREQRMPGGIPTGAGNRGWRTDTQFTRRPDTAPIGAVEDAGVLTIFPE